MSKATNYNWWQYARYVYNIGRTSRYKDYSVLEVAAIKTFLTSILTYRPELTQRINLKNLNSLTTRNGQNNYSLGLMVQTVGRCLKAYSLSVEEKALCDTLFAATGDRKNKVILPYVDILGAVSPANSGTISGTGSYAKGTTVSLTATAARGYTFSAWQDSGTAGATRQITANASGTYTATFTGSTSRSVSTSLAPSGSAGSINITGPQPPYYDGDVLTLTATPAEGYRFLKWEDDSTEAVRQHTISGNASFTATFEAIV